MNRVTCSLTALAIALGVAGCHQAPPQVDRNSAAIRARFGNADTSWVIKRTVKSEDVTCGYESDAGLNLQPFIVRAGRVWQKADLPTGQFDEWQDGLCGPDWVKPLPQIAPAVS